MKTSVELAVAVAAMLLVAGAAGAAESAPATPAQDQARTRAAEVKLDADGAAIAAADRAADKVANEPNVKRTVIDDGRARIEELRVRGQLQKVTVLPKDGAPGYEIIVGDGSRDLSPGVNTSRGASGQRVWNVFRF